MPSDRLTYESPQRVIVHGGGAPCTPPGGLRSLSLRSGRNSWLVCVVDGVYNANYRRVDGRSLAAERIPRGFAFDDE